MMELLLCKRPTGAVFANGVVTPTAMQRATLPSREGPRRAAGGQVGTVDRQE